MSQSHSTQIEPADDRAFDELCLPTFPQSSSPQTEAINLKDLKLGPKSTTAEVRTWIAAWQDAHLVELPPDCPDMLDKIFWDGRHISETSGKLLYDNLQEWMDYFRAHAIVVDMFRELGRGQFLGEENERVTWSERFEGVVLPLQVVLFAVALFLASLAYKTHKEAGCDV